MMHAIKGGWAGQTFALAKCNESEGKKSRIRRSKKERKAMVESFIKKYQSSNNGNFPSLNLTHKEVGGSFYTVREIVREIIQENRVLGPAKLTSEDLINNKFDEEFPLGTISTEPESPLELKSNGSPFLASHHQGRSGHHQGRSEELVSNSDGLCGEQENQMSDNVPIINGTQVDVRNEGSPKSTCEQLQTSKSLETEERIEKLAASTAKVTPITAEVVVETFPLRPVPMTADFSGEISGVKNLTETKVDQVPCDDNSPSDQIHSLENSGLVDNKVVEKVVDPHMKSSDCSVRERETLNDAVIDRDVELEVSHVDVLASEINEENEKIGGTKEINAQNVKIQNGTYGSSNEQESRTPKANVIENKAGTQHKQTSQKGSNQTVDRINLESWQRVSRNSTETESNPLLAIFKSFVTAFIKFWSE